MKICCDIDGVLADVRGYVKEYLLRKNDWKAYFEHTLEFPLIDPMAQIIKGLWSSHQRHEVFIVTGRSESNRDLTLRWFFHNFGHLPSEDLLMRPSKDSRRTCEIKMERFRKLQPDLIIDDDPEVVKAATEEGFVVLQVHGFRVTEKDSIPFTEVT